MWTAIVPWLSETRSSKMDHSGVFLRLLLLLSETALFLQPLLIQ